jgi:hypothetical protein
VGRRGVGSEMRHRVMGNRKRNRAVGKRKTGRGIAQVGEEQSHSRSRSGGVAQRSRHSGGVAQWRFEGAL